MGQEDVDELELLTRPGREDELRIFLLLLHPADLAELVDDVSPETAKAILQHLDPDRAAALLSELVPEDQEKILRLLRPQDLAPIVGEMETDDVADLLQEVDKKTAEQVLATLTGEDRAGVTRLLEYDPASAGGIMQTELVSVPLSSTVGQAIEAVRRAADQIDIISVFVVDDVGRYAGQLALQTLVLSSADTPIERVMEPKMTEVRPEMDQEEVARIFDRYSLVELGVVEETGGRLIGRITADDVHEVLVEEADEDMLKMAGANIEVFATNDALRIARLRLPRLITTFFSGLLVAWILQRAMVMFPTALFLLIFVPVITGMSGNVGSQSAMIMIRGLATGHVDPANVMRHILKDVTVALIMGLICGSALTGLVTMWRGAPSLGLCVGASLACSMIAASILGSCEPPLLKRLGLDPAIAAGPLISALNDITGVIIYTLFALLFLGASA